MSARMQSDAGTNVLGESPKTTGESPVLPLTNPETGRLSVQTVDRLQRLVGGEARVEDMVLRFIADRYGAKSLVYLPPQVAREALRRPADFLRAVKEHCEPELKF